MFRNVAVSLFTLLLAVVSWPYYKRWSYDRSRRRYNCGSPTYYAHWDPLLGLDHFFRFMSSIKQGNSFQLAQDLFNAYGKTFVSNSWGKTVVHTSEPENFRTVLSTLSGKFAVAPFRHDALEPLLGDGVFVTDGVAHEKSRALLKPAFSSVQNRDSGLLEKHFRRMVDHIPSNGETVDLQPIFQHLFVDVSAELLLGLDVDGEAQAKKKDAGPTKRMDVFLEEFRKALKMAGFRIFLGKFKFLLRDGENMREACASAHSIVDKMIQNALKYSNDASKSGLRPRTFIASLAETVPDPAVRRNELLNVFLPSLDTTALALSDIVFQVARNPSAWDRLRDEVLDLKEPVNFQTIKSLTYLRWVVNEGLRLISPFGRNPRICIETCILPRGGGPEGREPLLVEKGSEVNLVFRSTQRDPNIWGTDAEIFRPERWEGMKPSAWEYLPFSAGPRSCPGQQMALLDCSYILARLAQTSVHIEIEMKNSDLSKSTGWECRVGTGSLLDCPSDISRGGKKT